ncbi:uncharacterized protein LOC129571852, partial [Sitodiplosis mosellana]|uniref:uncharacterized protein LOC129571852 n=1 Tax=Sitodiplosis mosellana TaxID=263140 RepID=UPI002443D053
MDRFVPKVTVEKSTDPPWRKRNDIPSIIEYNNHAASSDTSKAELFADFFESQYTPSDDIDLDNLLSECGDNAFDIELNEADVLKALLSINVNKGAGPDGISPKLLKNCAYSLAKPLSKLFNKSLQAGIVPSMLKNSRIVPIFKSGKKSIASNYRPVVIIPTMAKVFESIVNSRIKAFVNDDLKLILRITSRNDARLFQMAIDQLHEWCMLNKLYLNLKKCFVMTYAKNITVRRYEYTINNGQHMFGRVELHRDLGVIFDAKLTFANHIDTTVASAYGAL